MENQAKNSLEGSNPDVQKPALKPLVGRVEHRLDPKRRFTIPTNWFTRMGEPKHVYVMPSLTDRKCLEVFTPDEFDKRLEPYNRRALSDEEMAEFISHIGEIVSIVAVDTQNRIRVNDQLLKHAGIGGGDEEIVVLIGANDLFEIWSIQNRPNLDKTESNPMANLIGKAKKFKF